MKMSEYSADHWEKKYLAEKTKTDHYEKEIKELKQSRDDYKRKWEKAKKYKQRHIEILLQLAYDYLDFLELFEDETTVKRKEQVRNILDRMELTYVSKTEPQPQSTEKEGKRDLREQDYWRDN